MDKTKRIVVIGGGFAGIATARMLDRQLPPGWKLTLISQENFITYNPLLAEVVGASLLPGHVVAPHRQMVRNCDVCMAMVSGINLETRTIEYLGEGSGVIEYDHLVIACGTNANLGAVRGMADYALPLKTLGDALFLRNRVVSRLEAAELQPDVEARRWLTTFVVIGGGFSGVEVAGEISDFVKSSLRYYPRIKRDDVRVILVHGTERLLPEMSSSLGEFAYQKMMKAGIEIHLKARVSRADDRGVMLANGELVAGGTVVCTIGTAPNPIVGTLGAATERGRLKVAPDMSLPGRDNVWAIGDCAAVPNARDGGISPPTAQFADRQAGQLAQNILARIRGEPTQAFSYKPVGQLCSIGHNKAVAELFGVRLSGFVAWLLWRGVYLLKIPTFSRKARLYLEWNWAMFFPPDIVHFNYRRSPKGVATAPSPVPEKHTERTAA
jgi:NADH dehydrogenase